MSPLEQADASRDAHRTEVRRVFLARAGISYFSFTASTYSTPRRSKLLLIRSTVFAPRPLTVANLLHAPGHAIGPARDCFVGHWLVIVNRESGIVNDGKDRKKGWAGVSWRWCRV